MPSFGIWIFQVFFLGGAACYLAAVWYARRKIRSLASPTLWQNYFWFKFQAMGAAGAVWYLVAFLLLPADVAAGSLIGWAGFLLGFIVPTVVIPPFIARARFGPGSLTWTEGSVPAH